MEGYSITETVQLLDLVLMFLINRIIVDFFYFQNFLPSFPENDRGEKEQTLQRLFTGENFKFGNPVSEFFKQLKAGNFRPDIRSMRKLLRRAQYREYK